MGKGDSYKLGESDFVMFAVLFFVIPFGIEIQLSGQGIFENTIWSFVYWIVFNNQGIFIRIPWWSSTDIAFFYLYYTVMQFVFVYALSKYYQGKMSRRSIIIAGVMSILPGLLPVVIGIGIVFLMWGTAYLVALFIPFSIPTLFGFWLLKTKPSPFHESWVEEKGWDELWDKENGTDESRHDEDVASY